MIEISTIETPSLGNRSYLVSDGHVAMAVDPPRDIDRVLAAAADLDVAITHVFETHVHNDYLTGGLALARLAGARYCVNGADQVRFDRTRVTDADLIEIGEMAVRVVATPGHTFTHLSYVLLEAGTAEPAAVFTGGSMLNGSTGRPDLLGSAYTCALAHAQHSSVRYLGTSLPASTPIFPTHGFGSFCAANPATSSSSTIGAESRSNPALLLDRESFVSTVLAGLDAYPAYYAHMAPANAAGPEAADLTAPPCADADEVSRRVAAGEWVADLRARRDFAAGHLPGTFAFELSDSFATYLGWLIPSGTPLTVLADDPAKVAAAQRQLARIGIAVERAAVLSPVAPAGGTLASYPVADFGGLAAAWRQDNIAVVDVRRKNEWKASHIDGAIHLPLRDLASRAGELPDLPVWMHCQAGYRAFRDRGGRRLRSCQASWPDAH
jgi:hydroxyacylglutathione hydrolase